MARKQMMIGGLALLGVLAIGTALWGAHEGWGRGGNRAQAGAGQMARTNDQDVAAPRPGDEARPEQGRPRPDGGQPKAGDAPGQPGKGGQPDQAGQPNQAGQPGRSGPGMRGPGMMRLNLTDEQQQKAQAIRQKTDEQIQAVLTPEQKAKLEELRSQRGGPGGPGGEMRGHRGPGGPGGAPNANGAPAGKPGDGAGAGNDRRGPNPNGEMHGPGGRGMRGPGGPGRGDRFFEGLNLTDDQKAKIKAIREQQQADLRAILTPEQRAELDKREADRQARMQERQKAGEAGQKPE